MNYARTKINWMFDRKTARRKFGYNKNFSKRSKNYQGIPRGPVLPMPSLTLTRL
jgi:hypothetical protein